MSKNDMVMVPREHELKILPQPFEDLLSGAKTGEVRDCRDRKFSAGDSVRLVEISGIGIEHGPTGRTMCRVVTHIQTGFGLPESLCVLSYGLPVQQHQGEPVALPERLPLDSEFSTYGLGKIQGWNAYHDEIAKLGPLYSRPVQAAMWQKAFNVAIQERDTLRGDVEAMRRKNNEYWHESEAMRAQLDERDHQLGLIGTCLGEILVAAKHIRAGVGLTGPQLLQFGEELRDCLSASAEPKCGKCHGRGLLRIATVCGPADKICPDCASAEPSAPVEIDERAEFEIFCEEKLGLRIDRLVTGGYQSFGADNGWKAWQARAALACKP